LNNQFSIGTLIKTGSNEWSFIAPAATGYTGSRGLIGFTGSSGFTGSVGTVSTSTGLTLSPVTLTTATVGRFEYDGRVPYFTPQGLQRGLLPDAQFFRLNAGLLGANALGTQNTLGVVVTLSSSTVYAFEFLFTLTKIAGTTSHTLGYQFGGTATVNNTLIYTHYTNAATGAGASIPAGTATHAIGIGNTTGTFASAGSIVTQSVVFINKGYGTVSINAGGTFIPQYTLSAAPGGAYTVQPGSFLLIYPIGIAGANTSVGTWA
jgi:hypothetical protein